VNIKSFFLLLLLLVPLAWSAPFAQDSSRIVKQKSLSSRADEVERLLKKGAEPKVIAQKYEEIGREFKLNGQNNKAIQYFNKAVEYYNKAKLKDDASRVLREIAQIQEVNLDFEAAADNYEKSAIVGNSAISKTDAQRVSAPSNESKIAINQRNIENIREKETDEVALNDRVLTYSNQATLLESTGKTAEALSYSKEALQILEDKSTAKDSREFTQMKVQLSNQLSDLYLKNEQIDNAISTAIASRQMALESGDMALVVKSSADLSELYMKNKEPDNALLVLKDAYRMALNSGRTLDARLALTALIKHFSEQDDTEAKLFFYQDFVSQLETLIARDSSMLDEKIFYAKEERIEQLEKERALQDELLDQSRNFNYGLVVFFVALFLASAFLYWSLMKVRMQNKRIALQSLRREMNPHFVFNSLNSVNRFIAQNDEIKANNYLTSYAQLMRTTMEISSQDFIRLDKEIELLTKYLDLEHLRFSQHFDYRIELDENVELENCSIPGFLIQPHLENAIWHGLRYKKEKGLLLLKIAEEKGQIVVSIEDNGIGIQESQQLKTENQKSHLSRGFLNIKERIELLNSLYKFKIQMRILSPTKDNIGTTVLLILPKTVKNG